MKTSLQRYLRENARHGTNDFPVGFYDCRVPYDYQDLPTHWHEEIEFTKVVKGTLRYTIGSYTVDVKEGDLLLIAPDMLHSAHRIDLEEAETRSIVANLNLAGLENPDGCTMRYVRPIREGRVDLPPVVHPGGAFYQELSDCFERLWWTERIVGL